MTWMTPEDITLSEMSLSQKGKYRVTPSMRTWRSQSMEQAERQLPGEAGSGEVMQAARAACVLHT